MTSDEACRFGVWWAHKRKTFTTARQAAWAAWTEARSKKPAVVGHVEQPVRPLLQGGMNNAELLAAWMKKLPGVEPSERELSAFAVGVEVGVEVGFEHARKARIAALRAELEALESA